jgi:hypothetical protein
MSQGSFTFVVILVDLIVLVVLWTAVSNGWKSGAVRSLTDLLSSVGKIVISGFGAYHLMKVFNPIPANKISDFLLWSLNSYMNTGTPDRPEITDLQQPEQVELLSRLLCVLMYFILFMIIVSAIERALLKKSREKAKKEDKTISQPDHIAGAFLGFLLFLIAVILPCPVLISAELTGAAYSGKDIVYKSFLAYPVNLAARPLTRLIAGEETDKALWEEKGFLILDDDAQKLEKWVEDNGLKQ